jgi:hypothetical protein
MPFLPVQTDEIFWSVRRQIALLGCVGEFIIILSDEQERERERDQPDQPHVGLTRGGSGSLYIPKSIVIRRKQSPKKVAQTTFSLPLDYRHCQISPQMAGIFLIQTVGMSMRI